MPSEVETEIDTPELFPALQLSFDDSDATNGNRNTQNTRAAMYTEIAQGEKEDCRNLFLFKLSPTGFNFYLKLAILVGGSDAVALLFVFAH